MGDARIQAKRFMREARGRSRREIDAALGRMPEEVLDEVEALMEAEAAAPESAKIDEATSKQVANALIQIADVLKKAGIGRVKIQDVCKDLNRIGGTKTVAESSLGGLLTAVYTAVQGATQYK